MRIVLGNDEDLLTFFNAHGGRLNVTFDEFKSIINGWEIWRVEENEKPIAVVLKNGDEGHISTYGEFVGIKRIKRIIATLGIKKTRVGRDFPQGKKLAERLGFHVEMTENGVTHYVRCF